MKTLTLHTLGLAAFLLTTVSTAAALHDPPLTRFKLRHRSV